MSKVETNRSPDDATAGLDDSARRTKQHARMLGFGSLSPGARLIAFSMVSVGAACAFGFVFSEPTERMVWAVVLTGVGVVVFLLAGALLLAICGNRPRCSIQSLVAMNAAAAVGFACFPWQVASCLTIALGLLLALAPLTYIEGLIILATALMLGLLMVPGAPSHAPRKRPPAPAPTPIVAPLPPRPMPIANSPGN